MANYCVYSGGNGTSGAVAGSVPTSGEWSTAYQSINAALAAITLVADDIIFVANDHAGSVATNISFTFTAFAKVISIDRSNTSTATCLSGATETASGNFSFSITGPCYIYGLSMICGTGSSHTSTELIIGSSTSSVDTQYFDTCSFYLNSTNTGKRIYLGSSNSSTRKHRFFKSCKFKFASTSQGIVPRGPGLHYLTDCSIDSGGSKPSSGFQLTSTTASPSIFISASDFSYCDNLINVSGNDDVQWFFLQNSLVPSTITTGTHPGIGSNIVECHACSSATDDHAYQYYYQDGSGTITHDLSVYLTSGGATITDTDGTADNYSLKLVSNANTNKFFPLYSPWFNILVSSTGSKTFSVKVAHTESAVLKDTEIWLEIEYMGNTAHPMTTLAVNAPVVTNSSIDVLSSGSNLTDTTEGWTGITSEKTHTLSKTVTINQQGYARVRIGLAKASITAYLNATVSVG